MVADDAWSRVGYTFTIKGATLYVDKDKELSRFGAITPSVIVAAILIIVGVILWMVYTGGF